MNKCALARPLALDPGWDPHITVISDSHKCEKGAIAVLSDE